MSNEIISWIVIVALIVLGLGINTAAEIIKKMKSRYIQIGTESDMFFCPGDVKDENDDDL